MSIALPKLYYRHLNEFCLLPEWSYFYMTLGAKAISLDPPQDSRIVIGIASPTRAFAAILLSVGSLLEKSINNVASSDKYFDRILSLEPGTPVQYRTDNHRRLRGHIDGFKEINGKWQIIIRTAEGTQSYLPLEKYAARITVSESDVTVPKHQQKGRRIESPSDFLISCLGKEASNSHVLESSFDVLLIGKETVLRHEATEVPFWTQKTSSIGQFHEGYLQEILRVQSFSGANHSYKSKCVSLSTEDTTSNIGDRIPPLVIFDGALAFLKHQHFWKKSHLVAIFDRTERQFDDAIQLLNQNHAHRISDEDNFSISIPNSVEMMLFREAIL